MDECLRHGVELRGRYPCPDCHRMWALVMESRRRGPRVHVETSDGDRERVSSGRGRAFRCSRAGESR